MKRTRPAALVLAIIAFNTSGCIVFAPFETRHPLSGQLVSAPSGEPVAGAEVVVDTVDWGREKLESASTKTDERGQWSMPGKVHWQFALLGIPEGPSWGPEVTFRSGERAETIRWATPALAGGVVDLEDWQARFDEHRPKLPRAVPAFGVMVGKGQTVCAYGGGLVFLSQLPVRVGLRGDGEVGVRGAAAFTGLAIGAPSRLIVGLNFDLGARLFRPWDGTSGGGAALGPEISFELLSLRVMVANLRSLSPDATGQRVWTRQILVGLGFM